MDLYCNFLYYLNLHLNKNEFKILKRSLPEYIISGLFIISSI